MKKRLLIIVSRLLQGGIDTILIEYLKQFDRDKFSIKLAVGICMEEQEAYIQYVPVDVPVHYLVKSHSLVKHQKRKCIEKLPPLLKLYDEAILSPIRRTIQERNLDKLISESDLVIDFDSRFYSFLGDCKIPKIAFFHFSFKQYHNGNQKKLIRLGKKLSVYDKIITICNEMKNEGIEMYPNLKDKFITIYNAFNFETIKERASEAIDSPLADSPYILAIQRLEESQKDSTTLIKAYKILIEKYDIEEKLYIIGEGKSKEELEALCRDLELKEKVVFLGYKNNPYPWIGRSRLFALSSRFEGLPTVLIEAMSLGRAIVATNCPTGPMEILDNGNAGILVPMNDENSMAEAMHKMLTDTAYKEQMLEGAKRQLTKFDINHTIIELENLILNL